VVVVPGHCAAGGGGLVLPVASGAAGATGVCAVGVCAKVGRAIVPPIAVLASKRLKSRLVFIASGPPKKDAWLAEIPEGSAGWAV
jgi:hypothetical protein